MAAANLAIKPSWKSRPDGQFGVRTMVWRELKGYMIDGLFVLGGIAIGGPAIIVMASLFAGTL